MLIIHIIVNIYVIFKLKMNLVTLIRSIIFCCFIQPKTLFISSKHHFNFCACALLRRKLRMIYTIKEFHFLKINHSKQEIFALKFFFWH